MDEEVITVILLSVCSVIIVAPSEIWIFSNPVMIDSWADICVEKPIERKYINTKNILMLEALRIDLGNSNPEEHLSK